MKGGHALLSHRVQLRAKYCWAARDGLMPSPCWISDSAAAQGFLVGPRARSVQAECAKVSRRPARRRDRAVAILLRQHRPAARFMSGPCRPFGRHPRCPRSTEPPKSDRRSILLPPAARTSLAPSTLTLCPSRANFTTRQQPAVDVQKLAGDGMAFVDDLRKTPSAGSPLDRRPSRR